jgi:hypothetical protein
MNLEDFAYKKQGPTDAGLNAIVNGAVTYFLLSGYATVAVISSPGGDFTHSLMGTLVAPAVLIAFVISLVTTKGTIKKRVKGEVTPSLPEGLNWSGSAWKKGLIRAVINILVVYGIGGIIVQISPNLEVPRGAAAIIVATIAGIIAYIESVNAVLATNKLV